MAIRFILLILAAHLLIGVGSFILPFIYGLPADAGISENATSNVRAGMQLLRFAFYLVHASASAVLVASRGRNESSTYLRASGTVLGIFSAISIIDTFVAIPFGNPASRLTSLVGLIVVSYFLFRQHRKVGSGWLILVGIVGSISMIVSEIADIALANIELDGNAAAPVAVALLVFPPFSWILMLTGAVAAARLSQKGH